MKNNISIGILDVYSQATLDKCLGNIPEDLKSSVFVVSNTNNKIPKQIKQLKFSKSVSLASMRNAYLTHTRTSEENKWYYFLFNSNTIPIEEDFFETIVKVASNFGTWILFGPNKSTPLLIEDEEKQLSLDLTKTFNPDFMFIGANIVKHAGFFNEQMPDNSGLDVLDFYIRCSKLKLTIPPPYYPTINKGFYIVDEKIQKLTNEYEDKKSNMSYGMFYHLYNFIPEPNSFQDYGKDKALSKLEELQSNYSVVL